MYLNQTTEYALRTAAFLARQGAARTRAEDLAAIAGVPRPYASKILRRLTAAELLTSRKGRGGGFALARDPGEIRFVDVMRAVGFEPASDHCLFGWESCNAEDPCPLHPLWSDLKEAIEDWARSCTLADLRRTVASTLARPAAAPGPGPPGPRAVPRWQAGPEAPEKRSGIETRVPSIETARPS